MRPVPEYERPQENIHAKPIEGIMVLRIWLSIKKGKTKWTP